MDFIEKFKSILPKEIDFEELKDTVAADIWENDPETAAIIFLKRNNLFDSERYLSEYPDIRNSKIDPIKHFIKNGIDENRDFAFKIDKRKTNKYNKTNIKSDITVIMPVYNAEKFLRYALDSLKNQTFSNFEAICVNDKSTDDSLSILNEYAKNDNRFKIINNNKRLGAGGARNIALDVACGNYITFLDSDDTLTKDCLNKINIKIKETNADVIIYKTTIVDKEKNTTRVSASSLREDLLPQKDVFNANDCQKYIFNISYGGVGGKCVRRKFIERYKLKFPSSSRSEDFVFFNKSLVLAQKITTIKEPLYNNDTTINPESLENTKIEDPTAFLKMLKLSKSQIEDLDKYETYKQSFINSCVERIYYNIIKTSKSKGCDLSKVKDIFNKFGLNEEILKLIEYVKYDTEFYFAKEYDKLINFIQVK